MVQATEALQGREATRPDFWKQAEDQFRFLRFDVGKTLQRLREEGWAIRVNGKVGSRYTAVTLIQEHAMNIGFQGRSIQIVGGEKFGLVDINVETLTLFVEVEESVRPTISATSISRLAIEKKDGKEVLALSNRAGERVELPYDHRL